MYKSTQLIAHTHCDMPAKQTKPMPRKTTLLTVSEDRSFDVGEDLPSVDPNKMESHSLFAHVLKNFMELIVLSLQKNDVASALLGFNSAEPAVQVFDLLNGRTGMPVKRDAVLVGAEVLKYSAAPVFTRTDGPLKPQFLKWAKVGNVWNHLFKVAVRLNDEEYDVVINVYPRKHASDPFRSEVLGSFEGSYEKAAVDREVARLVRVRGEAGDYADGIVARLVELAGETLDRDRTEELQRLNAMHNLRRSPAIQLLVFEMERQSDLQSQFGADGENHREGLRAQAAGTSGEQFTENERYLAQACLRFQELKIQDQRKAQAAASAARARAAAPAATSAPPRATPAATSARAAGAGGRAATSARGQAAAASGAKNDNLDDLDLTFDESDWAAVDADLAAAKASGGAGGRAATSAGRSGSGMGIAEMLERSEELVSSFPRKSARVSPAASGAVPVTARSAVESAMQMDVDLRAGAAARTAEWVNEWAGDAVAAGAAGKKSAKKDKKKK